MKCMFIDKYPFAGLWIFPCGDRYAVEIPEAGALAFVSAESLEEMKARAHTVSVVLLLLSHKSSITGHSEVRLPVRGTGPTLFRPWRQRQYEPVSVSWAALYLNSYGQPKSERHPLD